MSELAEKILLKNQNTIVGLDGHQLKIWKAFELSNLNQPLRADKYYMSTENLTTQLANPQLHDVDALDGAVLLSSRFSDANLGQIHVIAENRYPSIDPPESGSGTLEISDASSWSLVLSLCLYSCCFTGSRSRNTGISRWGTALNSRTMARNSTCN